MTFGTVETQITASRQSVHGYELDEDSKSTPSGVLGHGSYGIVYRATDIATWAKVVLKIVNHESRADMQHENKTYTAINNRCPLPVATHWRVERVKFERMCNRLA